LSGRADIRKVKTRYHLSAIDADTYVKAGVAPLTASCGATAEPATPAPIAVPDSWWRLLGVGKPLASDHGAQ